MTNIRNIIINKKALAFAILLAGLFISLSIMQVQAAANDSSITLKKDPGTGLFVLTIKDPDGIQEFSLAPASGSSYGGGLSGCPTTFSINNVSFADPSDFQPVMPAYVIDCRNNTANLEIAPPKDGLARSKSVAKEETPPQAPAPTEAPKEEKKGGPLSADDIRYPVPDLGNCGSEAECRGYCDNSQHAKECFAFAKKYNLLTPKESEDAKDKFLSVNNGPGGCSSGVSCENYCNNVDHLDECISFAEKNGYYSGDELAQAKKYQEILKTGKPFPGGCKDRNSCEIYCNDADHMEECLNFAEDTGFMPKEEIDQARKILPLIQSGETPGGCTSKEQCEKYCSEDSHNDECIAFGEKAGLISPEDAVMIKKTGGKGPGGCHSKQQCEAYCEANSDECFQWAQDKGLVSEADLAKMKTGLSKFREQLDKIPPEVTQCLKDAVGEKNFEKLSNGEPVFDRSLEGKMKSCFGQITAQFSKQLNTLPPEAAQCIKDVVGEEGFNKLKSGESDESIDFGSLEGCFQQLQSSFGGGQGGPGGPSGPGGGGFSGPGGCKSIDECTSYCQDHQEECQNFTPPGGSGNRGGDNGSGQGGNQGGGGSGTSGGDNGGGSGGGGEQRGGPGGCQSQEECQTYCQAHYTDPACGGGSSSGGGGAGSGGGSGSGAVCDYARPPEGCNLIQGPNYNSQTQCGLVLSCSTPSKTQSCVERLSGLVGWWNGDMVSGATVPDIGGGNNNGTISGGVSLAEGKVGKAFQLNGSNGYINTGNPSNLNFGTGPFSLEAWFNWTGEGAGQVVNNIIRKSNYGPGAGSGYWLRIGQQLEFSVGATTQSEGQTLITVPIGSGAWHHTVATKDSSGNMQLYVDGRSQGAVVRQAANTQSTSGSSFAIGAWPDGNSEFFHGLIDEVSVYNRALSASEVQTIFNAGSGGKCSTASTGMPEQQDYCASFASVPKCEYVGAPGTQNYNYCKQCFPDK